MKRGKLLVISGFSGVGKGTVVHRLLERYPNYKISISATTRQPRNGETEGVHYFFLTRESFEKMIEQQELLEYAEYVDHYYGTPKKYVEENLDAGNHVILEIEAQGALQIKQKMPETILIFLLPPSAEELKRRLIGRNTESGEVILKRLEKAAEETKALNNYDYFVVNDQVDDCAVNINRIVTDNHPVLANKEQVETIKNQIINFSKGDS